MPKRKRSTKKRSASALSPNHNDEGSGQKRKVECPGSASKRRHLSTPSSKSLRDEPPLAEQKAAGEASQKFEQNSRASTTQQAMTGNFCTWIEMGLSWRYFDWFGVVSWSFWSCYFCKHFLYPKVIALSLLIINGFCKKYRVCTLNTQDLLVFESRNKSTINTL